MISARNWSFTLGDVSSRFVPSSWVIRPLYLIYHVECVPCGGSNWYYSGYVQFAVLVTLEQVKQCVGVGAQVNPSFGCPFTSRYESTLCALRVSGPWEFGSFCSVRDRDCTFRTSPPFVHVIVGSSNTGKSRYVTTQYPDAYCKDSVSKLWTGYVGQSVIVLVDFKGWLSFSALCSLCGDLDYQLETDSGCKPCLADVVVITSTFAPDSWYTTCADVDFGLFKCLVSKWTVYRTCDDHLDYVSYDSFLEAIGCARSSVDAVIPAAFSGHFTSEEKTEVVQRSWTYDAQLKQLTLITTVTTKVIVTGVDSGFVH